MRRILAGVILVIYSMKRKFSKQVLEALLKRMRGYEKMADKSKVGSEARSHFRKKAKDLNRRVGKRQGHVPRGEVYKRIKVVR